MTTLTLGIARLPLAEEPSPLLPHLSELIVGLVAFTLLFLFLRAKVFPMFEKVYAERHEAIEGGIERARQAEEQANLALAQYRQQLAEARHEASEIRAQAQADRQAMIEQARGDAAQAADQVARRAQEALAGESHAVRSALTRDLGAVSVDLAGKIVGESLADDARIRATVDRFIADLESAAARTSEQA